MISPTRFPNGFTNSTKTSLLGNYGLPDPTRYFTFFNDFAYFNANDWEINTVESGGTPASLVVNNGADGILTLSTSDGLNDSITVSNPATFTLIQGKPLFFKTLFRLSLVNSSLFRHGIFNQGPGVGLYFEVANGSNTVNFVIEDFSTDEKFPIVDLSDNEDIELGFIYDGKNSISVFLNDKFQLITSSSLLANILNGVFDPYLLIVANTAAVHRVLWDYLYISQERQPLN